MAKRFTDTEKFSDIWYRKLPILQKVIYEYLIAECNHAGIIEKFDIELMSFKIGADITMDDIKTLGDRVLFVSDSVLFLTKFCNFQYGELNPQNKVHNSVIKELHKWGLQAPKIPLNGTYIGTKDKDKDMDKDNIHTLIENKEEKEKEKEERKPDPFTEIKPKLKKVADEFYGEGKYFVTKEDCMRAMDLFLDYENLMERLPECLQKAKELDFNGYKPGLSWVLKGNNYADLINGVYDKKPVDVGKTSIAELHRQGMSEAEILTELRAKYG